MQHNTSVHEISSFSRIFEKYLSRERMDLNGLYIPDVFIGQMMQKWRQLHDTPKPDVFAYRLNVMRCRYLRGSLSFYTELNPQRVKLQRPSQDFMALKNKSDEDQFNFKNIKSSELLFVLPHGKHQFSFIINKNPLTRYHMIICPDVHMGLPQQVTMDSLRFCIDFLRPLTSEHRCFRIGFNSPGASSSVNHLHYHILTIDKDLYIDKAKLTILSSDGETCVYRLDDSMPTQAICWLFKPYESENQIQSKLTSIMKFVTWLYKNNMPYNVFVTPTRANDPIGSGLKVFFFARQHFTVSKDTTPNAINIGFCELAGFIPVGDTETFESLEEGTITQRIQAETGNAYQRIYPYFTE